VNSTLGKEVKLKLQGGAHNMSDSSDEGIANCIEPTSDTSRREDSYLAKLCRVLIRHKHKRSISRNRRQSNPMGKVKYGVPIPMSVPT
jgi:hypothetical protein